MVNAHPTVDICNLTANKLPNDLFNADRFGGYLSSNPIIEKVHKHSFYHLVYFTNGAGQHTIDFKDYPIEPGCIYFMSPGQVHNFKFENDPDGYVINFSTTFFDQLLINSSIIDQFSSFNIFSESQMIKLKENVRVQVVAILEIILEELKFRKNQNQLMIGAHLLQLFILVNREVSLPDTLLQKNNYNFIVLKKFVDCVEEHFRDIHLPKDYAVLLSITPSYLNNVCKSTLDMSSGEIIRRRILLEAKRMLINFEFSIATISQELNFFDTSYFIKFFKKYTQSTPEAFRRQFYGKT